MGYWACYWTRQVFSYQSRLPHSDVVVEVNAYVAYRFGGQESHKAVGIGECESENDLGAFRSVFAMKIISQNNPRIKKRLPTFSVGEWHSFSLL